MDPEKSSKILVVDDDNAIRALVERVLRREKFEVESAQDGFEAIEKLSRVDYATILLDLMMPRVDGLGVLRYLELERKADGTPGVIIMTASLHGAADAIGDRPHYRVLAKPFDIRQLISHVRELSGVPGPQWPQLSGVC
ncbi:MAG: response regulator transcription factor [Thermoanaerobaculia bacterium]